ncbi:histone deacetylase family protein [Polycladidibacter hongkongensis]|uniref:histone deacetylase family protein n=1 Tax=Polycladidibacter hongkongensis TaxID=1647556 RepID=UPI00082D6AF4|nr:histone deacetylase [Pseudovibrio hongkongensis]
MALAIVHHPSYAAELPTGHRFPMGKYAALARNLRDEGLLTSENEQLAYPVTRETLLGAHDATYVDAVLNLSLNEAEEKQLGLPLTQTIVERARHAVGGTCLAAELALRHGIACNSAGGTHHAYHAQGRGFCMFNDVAVAIRLLQAQGKIQRAMVIDLDVHQGDGTAQIFANDPSVFTFSVHAENNFPLQKQASDLDFGLEDGSQDEAYMLWLRHLTVRAIKRFRPDIVFFNAGVDIHRDDKLGRLAVSDLGLYAREFFVVQTVRSAGLPLVGVIGGGYSDNVETLSRRHAILFRVADQFG